jgi:hypothetical protein
MSNSDFKTSNNISLEESLTHMKNLIRSNICMGMYSNALFYANKIFFLTSNKDMYVNSDNLYDLAHCFYLNKEYYRCVNLIQKYNMTYYNMKFLNLLGEALIACEDYESVITYLEKDTIHLEGPCEESDLNFYHSIRLLLVGKSYEMQENKTPAIRNYIESLKYDPGNIEAFDILINHNLLSSEQKYILMNELNFNRNNKWLYDYYISKTCDNIYMTDKSDIMTLNEETGNIIDILYRNNDQDLMKIEAEKFFIARDYINTFEKLKKINDEDFYKIDLIPMYCSCMIELNKIGELYYLAHKLSNNCSDKYVSWFAVVILFYINNRDVIITV